MGNLTINQQYISPLIKDGTVCIIERTLCNQFNDYISNNYPWDKFSKDRIDWKLVDACKKLEWLDASIDETKEFMRTTCLSKYKMLGIVYSALQPGIVGDFDTIVNHLEELSAHTPWVMFIVGVSVDKYGMYKFHNDDFVELWTFKQVMMAPR